MARAKAKKSIPVRVVRLAHGEGLPLPAYQSDEAAGMDLLAAVDDATPLVLATGQRELVPTGLVMELPPGTEAQVRPRSGLALRHGITVLNSPGTIDSDYRGEVKVLLINLGNEPWEIQRGERIAQLVIQRVRRGQLIEAVDVKTTKRGDGGFGSTGTSSGKKASGKKPAKTKPKKAATPKAESTGKTASKKIEKPRKAAAKV